MFQTTLLKALKAADKILIDGVEVTKHSFLDPTSPASPFVYSIAPLAKVCPTGLFFRDQIVFVDQSSQAKAHGEYGDMNFTVLFKFLKCRQYLSVEDCA